MCSANCMNLLLSTAHKAAHRRVFGYVAPNLASHSANLVLSEGSNDADSLDRRYYMTVETRSERSLGTTCGYLASKLSAVSA